MTSLVNRLRVLSNDYYLEFLRIVNVLLFIIFAFYMIMILNSSFIINRLGKELFAIVGVISTLISFWIGSLKKVQLLNVLIIAENIQCCSDEYRLNGEEYFKVNAQCKDIMKILLNSLDFV